MFTGDTASTRSLNRGNDPEILEDDAQAHQASFDPVVSREHSDYTRGMSQRQSPAATRRDTRTIGITSRGSSEKSSPSSKKPKDPADTARNDLERRSEADKEPETPTSTTATSSFSSRNSFSSALSPAGPPEKVFRDLKKEQEGVTLNPDSPPRFPERNDFPGLALKILKPTIDVDIRDCVIILHDHSKKKLLHNLALRLQRKLPEIAFILLQAFQTRSSETDGTRYAYRGEAEDTEFDTEFLKEGRTILVDVIKNGLVAKCHFSPRNIVILGHNQGGTTALVAAASWEGTEFGGVISVGGAMPAFTPRMPTSKAKTPALILSGVHGSINDTALEQIREHFIHVEYEVLRSTNDDISEAEDIGVLLAFFAHRLSSEEWTKQAVISLDGGGIRGYGSLLILRALMDKIGEEEKRLDPNIQSSFAPHEYKPMPRKTVGGLDVSEGDGIDATATQGLLNSSLFLPCHYFTYAAGTSTGGLISIMLFRFRMTVEECIQEYKTLGAKVFGNPRPLAKGAILWHKFDHRTLEAVIKDVTQRYSEPGEFADIYAMNEDVCKIMVLAYADTHGTDYAYPFRTYQTRKPLHSVGTTGTYGDAVTLPIWQVARATSAAPTYFPPIEIPRGNMPGVVTFKDGGFGSNNPSARIYDDVIEKHGGKIQNMGPFISIGTGIPPIDMFTKKKGYLRNLRNAVTNFKAAMKLPSRTTNAHQRMLKNSFENNIENFPYFRFDGGERLGEVPLDEWKGNPLPWMSGKEKTPGCITLEKMFVATAAYLAEPDVQRDLTRCAQILVQRRRLRMRNSSEWDRYASFSYYDCNVDGCDKPRSNKAHEFREHLQKCHRKIADQEMEQRVKECRRVHWKYRQNSPDPAPPTG